MTTYNTGSPIGSTDARDLYDNAQNLDTAVNTPELTWTDRLGVVRRSMAGATGYENLGDYAAGLEFTNYNQILRYSGEFYRVSASTSLPFTTTGVWAIDEPSLVALGDAVLRAEIGEGVRRVENLATLKLVDGRFAGDIAYMTGRSDTGDGGEGHFRWVTGDQSANVTADTQNGIWVPGTDGTGVAGAWKRQYSGDINVRWFGASESLADNTAAIQAAHDALPNVGGVVVLPNGGWWNVEGTVNISKTCTIRGSGINNATNLIKTNTASSFFSISASGVTLKNLSCTGPGKDLAVSGIYAIDHVSGARFKIQDVVVSQVWGGVRLRGNLFVLRDVEVRDFTPISGIGFYVDQGGVTDGVGEFSNCIAQNGSTAESYAGVYIKSGTGLQFQTCDFMQCGTAMIIEGAASINCDNTFFDTSDNGGVSIVGEARRLRFSNCWFSSSVNGAGFKLDNTAGTRAEGVIIDGCEFYDNERGIWVRDNALTDSFRVSDCVFSGQTLTDIDIGQNVRNFSINGCRTGIVGSFPASPNGCYINAGCSDFALDGNWFHLFTDSSGATSKYITSTGGGRMTGIREYNPPSLADGSGVNTTVTLLSAKMGDIVDVSFTGDLQGVSLHGWVQIDGIVGVRFHNSTGGTVDLPIGDIIVSLSRVRP